MTNKDLFKEAIADAKQVREAALANAKSALEEALTPRLQSMLSMKLEEMGNLDEEMEEEGYVNEEDLEEDFDLSAILKELEDEDNSNPRTAKELFQMFKDEDLLDDRREYDEQDLTSAYPDLSDEEAEKLVNMLQGGNMEEGKEEGEEEEMDAEEEMESEEEEINIADLSVDELKDIIKDIVSQELGSEEMESEEEAGEEFIDNEEDAVDTGDLGVEDDMMEEINLDELLAELDALEEGGEEDDKEEEVKNEDLEEAISTINILRTELQEVNLLNAKLLYVNKIFKAKNLTEAQKVKVIASFDKATTAKEAKIVFESLDSALTMSTTTQKSTIKESLGFASKAAGNAPKKQIVEVNDALSRMQKLAGIIK